MALRRIVILASGQGSNFVALTEAVQKKEIPRAEIVGLICNKEKAPVLEEARKRGVPFSVISSDRFRENGVFCRQPYEQALLQELRRLKPDLICLAGYLLLLGEEVIRTFPGKILNIHPSLLPKFKGLHAQKQALQAQERETGCTVHEVTQELDSGRILCQKRLAILPEDTEATLTHRLKKLEHQAYTEAVRKKCLEAIDEVEENRQKS